jgi:mono/diheme cytochrome c family protein
MLSTKQIHILWTVLIAVGALAVLSVSRSALTAEQAIPSPDRGHALAQRLCQGCHVIADSKQPSAIAGVPTFRSIANQPGQSGERIKGILIRPHVPMPDMHLTNEEITDIITYLETLRTDKSIPPLLSPTLPSPPKQPQRS